MIILAGLLIIVGMPLAVATAVFAGPIADWLASLNSAQLRALCARILRTLRAGCQLSSWFWLQRDAWG